MNRAKTLKSKTKNQPAKNREKQLAFLYIVPLYFYLLLNFVRQSFAFLEIDFYQMSWSRLSHCEIHTHSTQQQNHRLATDNYDLSPSRRLFPHKITAITVLNFCFCILVCIHVGRADNRENSEIGFITTRVIPVVGFRARNLSFEFKLLEIIIK